VRQTSLSSKRTRRTIGVAAGALLVTSIPTLAFAGTTPSVPAFSISKPKSGQMLGVFQRRDHRWFAAVAGTSPGTVEPTAVDAATLPTDPTPPTDTTDPTPTDATPPTTACSSSVVGSVLPTPCGVFSGAGTPGPHPFAEPVDLSYSAPGALQTQTPVDIRVSDDAASADVQPVLYAQTVTAVRATATPVPGTSNATITVRVTDQYGQPVVGVPLRLTGHVAGNSTAIDQLAVSNAQGQTTFTGPGTGTGPAVPTGYPTGGYVAYADLNLNHKRGSAEPGFEVVRGTVSFAAPGKAFYHNDKRIKKAGGVYADALRGTRDAAARHYTWIDQDGQLAFASRAVLKAGAARVSRASDMVWVNAHGSPFNPKWMKKRDRFENHAWTALKKRPGLRDAQATFKQDARYHLGVEWEVKNIHPFAKAAVLDAAFANLAAAAQAAYGPAWRSMVQVKMLTNLSGGQSFALKVLKHAHAAGFTTILLARGQATRTQIPASAQQYVTYVRGAVGGEYVAIPPTTQNLPIKVISPVAPRRS
jgi:hypothetical protein